MTTTSEPLVRTTPVSAATALEPRKPRLVLIFALAGLLFLLAGGYLIARFLVGGPTSTPVGSSKPPTYLWVGVWTYQVGSVIAMAIAVWHWVIKPWRRLHRLTTDSLFLIAGFLLYWQDPLSNWASPAWTYNSMYINFGSWSPYVPGWLSPNQHLTPEPVVAMWSTYAWAMYGGIVLCNMVMRRARARWPQLSNFGLVGVAFSFLIFFDFVMEPVFIYLTACWIWPSSIKGLTVFSGHYYQFPVYEAVLWGGCWAAMACVRFFVNDRGETIVERGVDRVRTTPARKTGLRFLAIYGAMNLLMFFGYNVPWGFFALNGSAWPKDIQDRSYLIGGVCGPGTDYACPSPGVPVPKVNKSVSIDPDGHLNTDHSPTRLRPPAERGRGGNFDPLKLNP